MSVEQFFQATGQSYHDLRRALRADLEQPRDRYSAVVPELTARAVDDARAGARRVLPLAMHQAAGQPLLQTSLVEVFDAFNRLLDAYADAWEGGRPVGVEASDDFLAAHARLAPLRFVVVQPGTAPEGAPTSEPPPPGPAGDAMAGFQRKRGTVRKVQDSIDQIVSLRDVKGLKWKDIAKKLSITVDQAKYRYRQGKARQ